MGIVSLPAYAGTCAEAAGGTSAPTAMLIVDAVGIPGQITYTIDGGPAQTLRAGGCVEVGFNETFSIQAYSTSSGEGPTSWNWGTGGGDNSGVTQISGDYPCTVITGATANTTLQDYVDSGSGGFIVPTVIIPIGTELSVFGFTVTGTNAGGSTDSDPFTFSIGAPGACH